MKFSNKATKYDIIYSDSLLLYQALCGKKLEEKDDPAKRLEIIKGMPIPSLKKKRRNKKK